MPNPLYTYTYLGFGLVWYYGISTIVGYQMQNPLYTYILDIKDFKSFFFVDKFLTEPKLILLYTVKWFQVFLLNTNNSIYYYLLGLQWMFI